MKIIYIYGPDGSGKTFIAKELCKKLEKAVIIPFEPGKFGNLIKEVDSGFNGVNSAVNKSISSFKSFLFFIRYIIRFLFFKFRFSKQYNYAIFTRGPLEFGINDTHQNFPKYLGKSLQKLLAKNVFLLIRPVETILNEKPELPKLRILSLYEQYLLSGCEPIINIEKDACITDLIHKIK